MTQLYLILIIVAVVFVTLAAILKRYRRCPSDKILVIYGKTGKNATGSISSARCIHGGAAFIWPVFQDYAFLDLKPISIECNLTNASRTSAWTFPAASPWVSPPSRRT